ncbi:GH3 auxin-responsive promoter family protein [[Phormidium] sp. ETS-05]|uniref:GH3 family domain-containing protein n=1 Tax=[Phormidium] sp. ETS-05 TaxID=222819 RepID=UPI001E3C2C3F|nr:GH3 auxin-responsive promoter family protein [[Phormidium] sp. ETS-05]
MRPLIQLFGELFAPASQKFSQALAQPELTQQQVQQDICQRLIHSQYGESLGIKSLADWHHIPIVNYDDIEKWISPQDVRSTPPSALPSPLTPEKIIFYEKTSGSRGAAKLIPYTKSLRRSFNQMFCVWAHDLIVNGPKFQTGKVYFCISPQFGTGETNLPTLQDDSEYLDLWLRWLLAPFLVSAGAVQFRDAAEFKEKLALALLSAENLEIISIWSPSFLRVILDYIAQRFVAPLLQPSIQNLRRRATLREVAQNFLVGLQPSIQESVELSLSQYPWTEIWPNLKLISCWDAAQAADGAGLLRSLFPGVMVQGKGLLATEAPMTVPLIEAGGCLPVLDEVFFEFEDTNGQIYRLEELQLGGVYGVVVSQKGGLYRYRMGDRVRVTHFYRQTPCLEFLGREGTISDLVGEKLNSDFLWDIIQEQGIAGAFFTSLVPVTFPQPYYLLLLDTVQETETEIAQGLDAAFMRSPHYRQARLLGQLAPLRVLISPHIPEIITNFKTRSGQKWGDIKHPLLETSPIHPELLHQLEQLNQHKPQ